MATIRFARPERRYGREGGLLHQRPGVGEAFLAPLKAFAKRTVPKGESNNGPGSLSFASLGLALPRLQHAVAKWREDVRERGVLGRRFPLVASATMTHRTQGVPVFELGIDALGMTHTNPIKLNKKSKFVASTQAEIDDAFKKVDIDKSGAIDRGELQAACAALGLPSSDDYVDEVIAMYDR